MYTESESIYSKVKDIGEWQKLCSYKPGNQDDYKLDWWISFIEHICNNNNSITINIFNLKIAAESEFSKWPIEVLCLPNVFKSLINKQQVTNVRNVCNYIDNIWETSLEINGDKLKGKTSRIGFGWFNSLFGSFNSNITNYFSKEFNYKFSDSDTFVCLAIVKKIILKVITDIEQQLLGRINKSQSNDELVITRHQFNVYISENFSHIQKITTNILSDTIIWYFSLFNPDGWRIRPFVVVNMNSRINVYKFRKENLNSKNNKEIEITDSDIADVIIRVTELELQKSISVLEEKYILHDSKCREYALNNQKQLAINHLKQRHQIETALAEINEQLLLISQSKVDIDTSSAKMSLLGALESSSTISKKILNESEIMKKLENISQTREDIEFTQNSMNSLLQSCMNDGTQEENVSNELEKELDDLLAKIKTNCAGTKRSNIQKDKEIQPIERNVIESPPNPVNAMP
ncbi:Vps60p/Vps20p like protein involved in vacuolar protein sorting [Cryptosporidium ryanae]|uniref:Vps60p/Vps20p like protein involved in vacuolar protein sorting n=1 Tax=Cryptosporidium ryanae TaxID=515981 RepID=UPI00351A08DE|nr:Vps60p/Vps20p like protein involved in vacuolar protein sorting [Cryptosporidium ryanae]